MILDASALIAGIGDPSLAELFVCESLVAPDLIVPETLNAFWNLARAGAIVPDRSIVLATFDDVTIVPSRPYASRAADLAGLLNHPVYDCLYLAVAEERNDVLTTCDRRFVEKIGRRALRQHVRLLSR